MKTKSSRLVWVLALLFLTSVFACSPKAQSPAERESTTPKAAEQLKAAPASNETAASVSSQLPVRFQNPTYTLNQEAASKKLLGNQEEFTVKVGADITSAGPVLLRDIMKKLAALKNMNVSWASDVDQYAYVDVDISADDDFFNAIDNLLRQRDYFHVVQGNTIIVKFKETKEYHIAMPFLSSNYKSTVGAKVSDDSTANIDSTNNTFDIWTNIKNNLDEVLQIWSDTSVSNPPPNLTPSGKTAAPGGKGSTAAAGEAPSAASQPAKVSRPQSAKGYYTIDKPIGLVTVTAPRNIQKKVASYFNNLKKELYKQISIEAKILEVTISGGQNTGIDWQNLLNNTNNPFQITATFGPSTWAQPFGAQGERSFTISAQSFNLLVSAIETQGKTKVLANPRISVMNGQPALINVGKEVTYVKKVTKTVSADVNATTSYDVETEAKTSGIVMSVVPTILDNNEIIMSLVPVTSTLQEPIPTSTFGDAQVGLPVINVREMSTIVKIKQGDMLVVGGLISSNEDNQDNNVPLLGRLPLIGKLFSAENKSKTRTELVILLKPEIIS